MSLTARSLVLSLAAIVMGLNPATMRHKDPRSAMLVTPRWLQEHLHDPKLVLLHVGEPQMGDKPAYDAQHIPGAQFVSMGDVAAPRDTTPAGRALELPSPAELRTDLEKLGISDDSRIVVYFGKDGVSYATRVVLTLDFAGFGAATSMLDGGLVAWLAEGFPTTTDVPPVHAGKLSPLKTKPVTVTGEWVREHATEPGYALVDARASVFYDGVQEGGPRKARRKGHIPGALSVPFIDVWTDKGALRSPAELREIFTKAGVKPGDTIVGYCHVGQQATAMLFAARSLGYKTMLYDGSFEDWALRDWPVEVGPRGGKQ